MLHLLLEQRLKQAVAAVLPEAETTSLLVRPCPDPRFGDYQTNALMALAKVRQMNPRQLATQVKEKLEVSDWCDAVDIAGAGFLNFRLKPEAIARVLQAASRHEHLFFQKTGRPRMVVIDFSSPNVAKPMHIGHIRSTALGDSLARTLRLLGHRAVTDNHIGDWGTQFGMLLVGWKRYLDQSLLLTDPISEMERLYRRVSAECRDEPTMLELARQELVKLQGGDEENSRIWREMTRLSQAQFDAIYGRLGVKFDHTLGESFYNPQLNAVVQELLDRGIARVSDGAVCVFSDGKLPPKEDPFLITRDGELKDNPCLIQKSDGAFNYATTDLATLAYRLETWQPDEIVYITDGRQQLHFQQLFATFRRWHPEAKLKLAHVWFGSILGEDGKPFKTRSGETVKLSDVLDEAVERAFKVVSEKNPELSEVERREIARVVGIGAVKYADLLPNRQSDYVFSWDKMLALNGNTAPYLQYAYARICSIFRKLPPPESLYQAVAARMAESDPLDAQGSDAISHAATAFIEQSPQEALAYVNRGWPHTTALASTEELALARHLIKFGLVLEAVADEYRPNFLCNYLFELAGHFARFYENCPVLKAEGVARTTRLALCDLTACVLKQGLDVLGIETLEQM